MIYYIVVYIGMQLSDNIDEVWNVITLHLEILENDISSIIKDNINIQDAIESEIEEYKQLNDLKIVKYLMSFKH